ncbi:MAG: DNA-binding transcriptional ArsR family regulator [Pseudohongiellaceae bacterium]|jgi:DNA-binding transcriptional ArsR family regulator
MDNAQATKMSLALKSVSDVNRIRILQILSQGEFCVSDLVERLQIDQPKVSHHLAILKTAGIIRSRRDGRHINYSLESTVHHRQDQKDDVFDLGSLAVSFRFEAAEKAFEGAPIGARRQNKNITPVQPPLRTNDAQGGA